MKIRKLTICAPLLLVLIVIWGCEPDDPGAPFANQPPETRITVAPLDSVEHDHYVSPSSMFKVSWMGHDPDGLVKGFWIQVDNGREVWTIRGDSAIAFEASRPDPNDPTRLLGMHTIRVTAQDDRGLRDPTPATSTFSAINYQPMLDNFTATFRDSAVVGPGIYFGVEWSDRNVSGALFRLSVNDLPVTDWIRYSKYQFCDTSMPDIVATVVEQGDVQPVSITHLNPGEYNKLTVEVMDLGGAVSGPISRTVFVRDDLFPRLTSFSATYGTTDFFPDGSIFYRSGLNTVMTMVGATQRYSAATRAYVSYHGDIQAYRYRRAQRNVGAADWSSWSDWSNWSVGSVEFANLPVGEYKFNAQCRDFAGAVSEIYTFMPSDTAFADTLSIYTLTIVEPNFDEKNILMVNETKNGNGRPGSPDTTQIESFYTGITAQFAEQGWTIHNIRYASHQVHNTSYISPKDVYDKRIIIWASDDRSQFFLLDTLSNNLDVLQQYFNAGGKMILSGHDVLSNFLLPGGISFRQNYFRIGGGTVNIEKQFIGMAGNETLNVPNVAYDPLKIPDGWNGVHYCCTFVPEHRTDAVGYWRGNPANTPFENGVCCLLNRSPVNPWRTITLGFPLYFMRDADAAQFLNWSVNILNE